MTGFSIDNDLFVLGIFLIIFLFDFLLQAEYYRTSGINDFNIVAACDFISFGWFSVGTQQNFGIVQMIKVIMIDSDEAHFFQALHFTAIVHDVSQTIQSTAIG